MKTVFKGICTLMIIGGIVWYLGGIAEVGRLMGQMDPVFVLLVFLLETFDRSLMTYKWGRLLRGRGLHLPFLSGMKIYCASMVWGMFLPITVGADAIRAYSSSRAGLDSKEVIASILIERMMGLLSALFLGTLSLLLFSQMGILDARLSLVWMIAAGLLLLMLLGVVASFSGSIFNYFYNCIFLIFRDNSNLQKIKHLHSIYLCYRNKKKELGLFLGLTIVEQLLLIVHTWLIAKGLGLDVKLVYLAGAVPLSFLIARIPISINGLGVYDGAFMLLLSMAGIPPAASIAIALIGRILQAVSWLPWWLAYVIGSRSLHPPRPVIDRANY